MLFFCIDQIFELVIELLNCVAVGLVFRIELSHLFCQIISHIGGCRCPVVKLNSFVVIFTQNDLTQALSNI